MPRSSDESRHRSGTLPVWYDDGHTVHPSVHKRMKRFTEYSKRAILYEFPLATSLLVHRTATFACHPCAKVGIMLLFAALFLDLMAAVYLVLVGAHEHGRAPAGCDPHGVLVYSSAFLLMAMPYFLLLSLNELYAFLAVALAPLLLLVVLLFLKERRHGAEAGEEFPRPRDEGGEMEMSYEDYDGKLKKLFDASAAVNTIAGGAGLLGAFFGYSNNFSPEHDISFSESLLFLTIIAGQFVMLVTTARPRFRQQSSPPRLANFLGHLAEGLTALLSLSALAGAADFLGGLALLGFSLDFLELAFFFRAKFYSEEADRPEERRPDADGQARLDSLQLLWLCVMYVCFTALVALYSEHAGKAKLGWWPDRARVLLYFSAFCCCKLDGEGKLPLLPAVGATRNRHSWWGLARSAVMGLAALDGLWRIAIVGLACVGHAKKLTRTPGLACARTEQSITRTQEYLVLPRTAAFPCLLLLLFSK